MKFELNDPVTILRGGIDGFPHVNLAGVPGRVCSTHPSALPGMVSVWVDWSQTDYADVDGLPGIINNFPADLGPAQPSALHIAKPKKRAFQLRPLAPIHIEPDKDAPVLLDSITQDQAAPPSPEDEGEQDDEPAPPTLRLV